MNEGKDKKQKMKEARKGGRREEGWKDGRKEGKKIGGEGKEWNYINKKYFIFHRQ